ncbi:MAG: hypothetical protein EOO06_14375 [Chitinophagaceae bacterium]|nr:MAG: hypothetical protein EOO06_14375 [Chitinophagaceae bacterium]
MDAILKIYLPLYLIGFIVLVFVIPSIRVYRQTGINPFRFATNMDGAHDYIGGSMKVFILLLLMTVLLYSFSESAYNRLARFEYLEFFLILPNAITFAVLFSAYIVLHITMRLEEDFLQKQHGEAYTRYKNNVPRLIY